MKEKALNLLLVLLLLSSAGMLFAAPPAPTITGNTNACVGTSTSITASISPSDPNVTFRWYQDNILGPLFGKTLIFTGNPFQSPAQLLPGAVTYYVEAFNTIDNSKSALVSFVITTSLNLNVDVPLATPSDLTLCNGDSTTYTAISVTGNTVFKWYDALVGGNLLFTGNPYPTGPLGVAPSLYVSSVNAGGCESPRLIATPVVVLPVLDVPIANPPVAIICSGDSVDFNASALLGGTDFIWYDTILGGSPIAFGPDFNTGKLNNTSALNLAKLYYVETTDANGCKSLRTPATVTILPALDVPLVNPLAITACNGEAATFTATALLGATTFKWYDALDGGNLLFTGNPFTATIDNNSALELTTLYYVEAVDANGCTSLRTPATVISLPALDVPLVDPLIATACSGQSVDFTASSLLGNTSYYWYDALLGGNLLDSGATFNTGNINNASATELTTIFYVESRDANGCKSLRIPATVLSLPLLDVPLVDPLIDTACAGGTVTFNASSLLGGQDFNWYESLAGGVPIFTGETFTSAPIENTGALNLTKIFYVEAVDANGCKSLRLPATVLILPALDVPLVTPLVANICNGQQATFTATSLLGSTTFNWYDVLLDGDPLFTGPTFTSDNIENSNPTALTQIFYLEGVDANGCKTVRTPATVLILPALEVPLATPLIDTVCNGGTSTFTASSLLGTATDYNWYDAEIGGNLLFNGNPFVTPPLSNTAVTELTQMYFVEAVDANGCKSLRIPVTQLVLPFLDVPLVDPLVTPICPGDSATFFAYTLLGTEDHFEWYDNELGGNKLFEGNPFTTGAIQNNSALELTQIYYVEAVDAKGCKSVRTPAVIVVTPAAEIPLVNPLIDTICPGQRAEFTASSLLNTAATYNWYDSDLQNTLLFTGETFTTDPLSNNTATGLLKLFLVEAVDDLGCKSIQTPATVLITPAIDLPLVDPLIDTICSGQSAEFVANTLLGSAITYNWYDQLLGGNLLFTGDTFNTGPLVNSSGLNLTQLYYVEGVDEGGCTTLRTPATVLITPALDVPLASPLIDSICSGESAEFIATSLLGSAVTYNWYDSLFASTPIFTGDTFNTGPLTSQNTADLLRLYFVEAVNENGCTSLRLPVSVLIAPNLDVPLVNPPLANVCSGNSAQFVASALLGSSTFNWYDGLLGGNLLFTGDTFTTPTIDNQGTTDLLNTYFVEAVGETGCKSIRIPVIVTTLPAINAAIALPPLDIICSGNTSTFRAISLIPGNYTYNWYDDLLQGDLIFTGDTFTTDTFQNAGLSDLTRNYYLEAVDSNGCKSLRTPVIQIIRPSLSIPLANPLIDTVCAGQSALFTATSLLGSAVTFNWYDGLTGGNLVFTGDTFNTGPIDNSTLLDIAKIYFVEAVDTAGCKSLKTPVTLVVLPNLDVPLVNPLLATACSGQSVTFVASSLLGSGVKYNWYSNLIGGAPIFTGDTFTTDTIGNNGLLDLTRIFYVDVENAGGCKSLRIPATVIIRPALTLPLVIPPTDIVCNGQSANFSATALLSPGATFNWYDNLQGGTLLFTGADFTSPPLNNTTTLDLVKTFYVEAVDTSGCKSLRLPVVAVIRPAIDLPLVSPLIDSICSGGKAQFTATALLGSTGTFNWYTELLGGTAIFTGDTFTTDTIVNASALDLLRIYYVELVDTAGCTSLRTPASVLIFPAIDVPLVSPPIQTICSGDTVTYVANSILGSSVTFNWYDDLLTGNKLFTGDTFMAGPIYNNSLTDLTVIYYVEGVNAQGCRSLRTPATAIITPNPDIILLNAERQTICVGERATITATSVLLSNNIRWYLQERGGTPIFEGMIFTTDVLTDTITFYAGSENAIGCESVRAKIKIFVNPTDALEAPMLSCLPQTDENKVGFTWTTVKGADEYEVSIDGGQTWKLPSSGPRGTSHVETRSDGNLRGISLTVRALELNNICAPREGLAAIPVFCVFGPDINPDDLIIYNSFSPNGDGANDIWYVADGIENYPDNEVMVFNRWGQKVFDAKAYDNKKRFFDGSGLDDGAYFYVVRIPSLDIERTGYVMIIR